LRGAVGVCGPHRQRLLALLGLALLRLVPPLAPPLNLKAYSPDAEESATVDWPFPPNERLLDYDGNV